LEHNGGTAFNKEDAKEPLKFIASYPGRFSHFLDYKFSRDILREKPGYCYNGTLYVTFKVYKLVRQFCAIFRLKEVTWIAPKLDKLTDYLVEWGDEEFSEEEKWTAWADCSVRNEPRAGDLTKELDDLFPPHFTEKELVKKVTKIQKDAYKMAGKYLTPELKRQVNQKFDKWLEWALNNVRIEKKEVTYPVLPVRITKVGYKATAYVLVPFDGYGTKARKGFTCSFEVVGIGNLHDADGHISAVDGYLHLCAEQKTFAFQNKQLEAFLD
jgi:hypothetical protein